jgi:hypothetical protein
MARRNWSWRHIIKKPLSNKEHMTIYRSLQNAPDRVVALVCGSLIERALEHGIASRLRVMRSKRHKEIFDSGGVLIGLQSKIRMGYALNLYGDKTYAELDRIREIRNVFAHSAHAVRFATPRIARHCRKLVLAQARPMPMIYVILGRLDIHASNREMDLLPPPPTAREQYIYTCILLEAVIGSQRAARPRRERHFFARRYLA